MRAFWSTEAILDIFETIKMGAWRWGGLEECYIEQKWSREARVRIPSYAFGYSAYSLRDSLRGIRACGRYLLKFQ